MPYHHAQVVVVGGGVAGLTAAKLLAKQSGVLVTLVDSASEHAIPYSEELFQLSRLPHRASFSALAKKYGFAYVRGPGTTIDIGQGIVVVPDRRLQFNYLVLAGGSAPDFTKVVGAHTHAIPLWLPGDAQRLQHHLEFALSQRSSGPLTVAIVGGGRVGVSAAAGILDSLRSQDRALNVRIQLYESGSRLLGHYPLAAARLAEHYFAAQGVDVFCHSAVVEVRGHALHLADGHEAGADIIVWAAHSAGNAVSSEPAIPQSHTNRILVNNYLQVRPHYHIFAIGDTAAVPVLHRKPSIAETIQEAEYVAGAIKLLRQNKQPKPFQPSPEAEIIPLGTTTALYVYKNTARISPFYLSRYNWARRKYVRILGR
jgi:NADH dehydrogenase